MTYKQVIDHFGTQAKLAAALGITQPSVSVWKRRVPAVHQYKLEIITDGALKVDAALRHPRRAA